MCGMLLAGTLHQASFRCSGDNRVHADAVRSVINGHASHEGGNRALACTVRTARTSRKGDEPRWRRCAHDGTWHACVAHFPDSVLAREKGSGQIGVQNPSPRRGGKFVYEASQINAGTREQAIGSADFVGDNLKGFLDLLFRANIAREAQGALSALFHGFGGGLFCGFGIFVEYGDVVAARRAKKHDRAANAVCSAGDDDRACFD